MHSGDTKYTWTDSLSAFWPGLQVLVGDIEQAKQAHSKFVALWNKYGAVPERFDVLRGVSIQGINNYPLRPEFIESTYLLYRATRDPAYLELGKKILHALQNCKVECGYASIANVETSRLEDRMDSFFLSETCKYLYLLFDFDNFVNSQNYIFTTEGHPLPMNMPWHKNSTGTVRDICANHQPKLTAYNIWKDLRNNWEDPTVAYKWNKNMKKDQCYKDEAPAKKTNPIKLDTIQDRVYTFKLQSFRMIFYFFSAVLMTIHGIVSCITSQFKRESNSKTIAQVPR